ncbi:MAG: PHP domain-containing protein [Moorella sp. (in: Bacteria)]|nr:PHP domain-containing protein [Moorella sp. (in: firmicutes)]
MAGVDLHTHTTASDGKLAPTEVVRLARQKGLAAVGITDHDTVAGLAEARAAAASRGVTVVPGVELSTEWEGREIHILGYYIDWQQEDLVSFLEAMRQSRYRRTARMVERLQGLGYDISLAEVEEEVRGEAMGRPHIAAALVRKGYLPSIDAAFNSLLEPGRPAYVPCARVQPGRAIKLILEAGGVHVLAHPGLSRVDALIPALVADGLKGIEAYYPRHDVSTTRYYLELAALYRLVVTGGSDFHGDINSNGSHADLGTCRVDVAVLEHLQQCAPVIKSRQATPAHRDQPFCIDSPAQGD